jgi:hypothetical protein
MNSNFTELLRSPGTGRRIRTDVTILGLARVSAQTTQNRYQRYVYMERRENSHEKWDKKCSLAFIKWTWAKKKKKYTGCFKKSITMVFQMLLSGESYENVRT